MAQQEQKRKRASPTVKLVNNQTFPLISLSTKDKLSQQQMTNKFRKAFQYGYRHIDCSRNNGNEVLVGKAIKTCINQQRVKRQDIWITTKTFNHISKNPILQLKQALKLMNLEYVDLYCLQFPVGGLDGEGEWTHRQIQDIWKDMEQCIEKGYTKNIGVCNFSGQAIQDLISYVKVKPICNQIEVHPYLNQTGVVERCQKNGIHVISTEPLCSRSTKQDSVLSKQQALNELGQKYNKSISQIAIKSLFSKDIGALIETSNHETMKQLYESWNFELSEQDQKKIRGLNKNYRVLNYEQYFKDQINIFE